MKAVWWIKRDFRIFDNDCIRSALLQCGEVLPFFCWENKILEAEDFSLFHLQAQWQALDQLNENLHKRGGSLYVARGELIKQMEALHQKYPFTHLFTHEETGNVISFQRDREVAHWCRMHGVEWKEFSQSSVLRGGSAETRRRRQPSDDYRKSPPVQSPDAIPGPDDKTLNTGTVDWSILCHNLPKFSGSHSLPSLQRVDERSAGATLRSFLKKRGEKYSGGISSPNTAFDTGSRLSVHLTWGTISLRSVFSGLELRRQELNEENIRGSWKRSLRAFESRLYWRDHFIQRLESAPDMEDRAINPAYENLPYGDKSDHLEAWIAGQTGFPMVDACMRCLNETGFMNFRMRAMVVSFACFGLHLSWRTIHRPLACLFTDYEPGVHLSQLQMQAGVMGINALRVYSPAKQFLDQDPDGKFIKRWVPELESRTPVEIAHAEDGGLSGYAAPVVDLKTNAKWMKDQIFAIRRSETGRAETQKTLKVHGSQKRIKRRKKKTDDGQLTLFD